MKSSLRCRRSVQSKIEVSKGDIHRRSDLIASSSDFFAAGEKIIFIFNFPHTFISILVFGKNDERGLYMAGCIWVSERVDSFSSFIIILWKRLPIRLILQREPKSLGTGTSIDKLGVHPKLSLEESTLGCPYFIFSTHLNAVLTKTYWQCGCGGSRGTGSHAYTCLFVSLWAIF